MIMTYPLLVRLVNSIQGILDGNTLEVSCCYLHAEREVKVNSLDLGSGKRKLEECRIFDR
jgi:hypothetical protein